MSREPPHIVDVLIAERAPRLTASALWPVIRPGLYALLGYGRARAMADSIRPLPGAEALEAIGRLLALEVSVRGLEHVPESGACVVICNHPTGIADGVAMLEALKARRRDVIFFANADALRVSPRLAEVVIPVEWVQAKRTREKTRATLDAAHGAFTAGRCLAMFPAGRLARVRKGRLTDPEWAPTAVSLARRHGAPIVPAHMTGPPSTLFHLFDRVSDELRDITLFHELLNKAGRRFEVTFAAPVPPQALGGDAGAATLRLKGFIEGALALDPQARLA